MKKAGFTLIELMIVVAIVSIMGSFGVSMVGKSIKRTDARKMKEQIPVFIETAIERAFEQGSPYSVAFYTDRIEIDYTGTKLENNRNDVLRISKHFTYEGTDFNIDEQGGISADSRVIIQEKGNPIFKIEIENISNTINYALVSKFTPGVAIENLAETSLTEAEKAALLNNDNNWIEFER